MMTSFDGQIVAVDREKFCERVKSQNLKSFKFEKVCQNSVEIELA